MRRSGRGRWSRGLLTAVVLVGLLATACGDTSGATAESGFSGFDGCQAGADSVVAFLQRTLDDIGDAAPDEVAAFVPEFDEGVHALLLRAQEVHCTEAGFNDATIARVDDLEAHGTAGELLMATVRERGLGSLDNSRGGPIRLGSS